MTRRAYLYFIIIFIIGVILGGVGLYTYAWNTGRWRRHWNEQAVIHNLQKQLELTPTQVQGVRSILDAAGNQFHALQEQQRPLFDALRERTDGQIRELLTPHQASEFDAIIARLHASRKKK